MAATLGSEPSPLAVLLCQRTPCLRGLGEDSAIMALSQREQDIQLMLAASVHLGTKQCDFQMERYVYRRRNDGIYVINLGKTWEKLQLAARVIVAIENPQDVVVQSARPYAQRAVLKFAQYTHSKALAGRYTPGAALSSSLLVPHPCISIENIALLRGQISCEHYSQTANHLDLGRLCPRHADC